MPKIQREGTGTSHISALVTAIDLDFPGCAVSAAICLGGGIRDFLHGLQRIIVALGRRLGHGNGFKHEFMQPCVRAVDDALQLVGIPLVIDADSAVVFRGLPEVAVIEAAPDAQIAHLGTERHIRQVLQLGPVCRDGSFRWIIQA